MISIKCVPLGSLGANCYFLCNQNEAVIIDPGSNEKLICNIINELNVNVKHIILTHGHFDHIGAVSFLKEHFNCNIYIHIDDVTLLKTPSLNLSDRFGTEICYIGDFISVGEETLNLIGYDFKFISTPGHTPGSMCIKVDNKLFTGDTLFRCSIGNAFPPYGDTDLEISSIKQKILCLDDNTVCYPGHGEPTTINYEKQFNPYLN